MISNVMGKGNIKNLCYVSLISLICLYVSLIYVFLFLIIEFIEMRSLSYNILPIHVYNNRTNYTYKIIFKKLQYRC